LQEQLRVSTSLGGIIFNHCFNGINEMSSRIGIISGRDAIRAAEEMHTESKGWGIFIKGLVLLAVVITCFGFPEWQ